jgi:iron(III) transport system substrate-binding protein
MRTRLFVPLAGAAAAVVLLAAGCSSGGPSNAAAAKTVNSEFAALQAMPPAQAEQKLVQEATKEGSVNWYTVTQGDDANLLAQAFEKAYPGIKVNLTRSNEPGIANTFNTETRAHHYNVDVLDDDVSYMDQFHTSGLVANIPTFGIDVPAADRGEWWVVPDIQPAIISWNTNLVPNSQAPTNYQDLLNPKWKGKLVIDVSPDSTVQTLIASWGLPKATQWLTQLMNTQDPTILQSHTQIDQLMAAGKYAVCVECFAYDVVNLKDNDHAPLNYAVVNPTPTPTSPTVIAAHAPHPYAALLLLDWLASKPGAQDMAKFGMVTQTAGVNLGSSALNQIRDSSTLFLDTPDKVGSIAAEAQNLVNTLVAAKVAGSGS